MRRQCSFGEAATSLNEQRRATILVRAAVCPGNCGDGRAVTGLVRRSGWREGHDGVPTISLKGNLAYGERS